MNAITFHKIVIKSFGHNTIDIRYNKDNRVINQINMCIVDADDEFMSFVTLYHPNVGTINVNVNDIIELVPHKV